MATIAEIRERFPQYDDLSDRELADRVHQKFYPDMSRAEFNQRVDMKETGALADAATQFFENFNRGMYATANLPTTLANMATDALGIDYQFKRPLEAAAPGLDRMAMEVPEAQTPLGEVAGTVGEYTGAAALPAGGLLAAAPRLAARTATATTLPGQVVQGITKPIAAAPGTAAAGEAVSAVGSGLGASMAGERGGWQEYLGATAGGMVAPWLLALTPTNLARQGVNAAKKRLSPKALDAEQRRQISEGIRQDLTPEARQNIAETAAIRETAPDYRPSIAEATESPQFVTTQQNVERGLSGPDLDQSIRRYGQNEAAINRAIAANAPDSPMDLDDAFGSAQGRLDRMRQGIDAQEGRTQFQQERVTEGLRSDGRRRAQGQVIREELIGNRAAIKEEMSVTAREMGLNDENARFPFADIRGRLIKSVEPRSKLTDRSALPNNIIADIRNMDDSASIVDLMELRSRIGADIREARRTPTGEKRVPYLTALQTELDAATEQLIRGVGEPDLADNLKRFRDMYRQDYIVPFEQGAAGRVLKTDAAGAYAVPDERVAKEFFDGWNQTAADQFNRVFPEGSPARGAMRDVALDDLANFAVRDGVIQPNLVESWIRKNAGILRDFPEIQRRVSGVQQTLGSIAKRQAVLTARRKQIENSFLARELSRIDSTATSPEGVVTRALQNPARMRKLMRGLRSQAAKDAVARQVWETALSAGDPAAFLNQNVATVGQALGAERLKAARRLAAAIRKNQLVPRPSGQPIDANPVGAVENVLGTGLNQISSRIFAVKSGRTSARYALADIMGRAFRNMTGQQARQTLQDAIYDPQIAIDLANAIQSPQMVGEKQAKRLYTFLVTNGIVAGNEEPEQF